MDETTLNDIWNYYLCLEKDLANTSRYIEPREQENVYSYEFTKILILSCTEVESLFKKICFQIEEKKAADIGEYKQIILKKYPKIVLSVVNVGRLGKDLKPFDQWNSSRLLWWNAYQKVKHNRGDFFCQGTYQNAVNSLAALYILIFYLSKITNIEFDNYKSDYIQSSYRSQLLIAKAPKQLPDFES